MKKKIFIAIVIAALCFSIAIMTSGGKKVHADETISDLSYSYSSNLLDLYEFEYDSSNELYHTLKKIYLPKSNDPLVIVLCYGSSDARYPTLCVNFYDIDFDLCGSYNNNQEDVIENNGLSYRFYSIPANEIPTRAFSFEIEELSFEAGDFEISVDDDIWVMAYRGTSQIFEYVDYEPYTGLIDINNNEFVLEVSYANPLTRENILSCLDAEDDYAGNLKSSLTIGADEYLSNASKIGTYPVSVSVSDGHNTTLGNIYIHVVDKIKPVITGPDSIRIPVFTNVTKAMLKESFSATDVYDGDITSSIDVVSTFESHPTSIFEETITLKVLDSSNNFDTKSVLVEYYDSIPPVITGPETIMIGYKAQKTIEQIVASNLSITDDLEPHPIISYPTDEYSGNENKVGTYSVVVEARDTSGTPVTHPLSITVSDTIKPVIFINSYIIETIDSITLSREDIDDLLYASNVLTNGRIYSSVILNDTYTGHENEKGHYIYQVKYIDNETNEEIIKAFQINVNNDSYVVSKVADVNKTFSNLEIIILSALTVSFVVISVLMLRRAKKMKSLL